MIDTKLLQHRSGKRKGRVAALVGGVVLLAAVGGILAARAGLLTKQPAAVEQRYARADSRFTTVDGVRIHYVDEGRGPVVILLHGSYLDLNVWDGWARELARTHRVIRIDRTPFGLTGLDPRNAYSYEREADLFGRFVDRLAIGRFTLVGASSAGTSATRYAARHPDRISGIALFNFPLSRSVIKPPASYASIRWIRDKLLLRYQPRFHTARMIAENTVDPAAATPALIDRLTDEANRAGVLDAQRALEAGAGKYGDAARQADLAALRAPALLVWGERNPLLTVESGRQAFSHVGSENKKMIVMKNASHMIPVEQSNESLRLFTTFLQQNKI